MFLTDCFLSQYKAMYFFLFFFKVYFFDVGLVGSGMKRYRRESFSLWLRAGQEAAAGRRPPFAPLDIRINDLNIPAALARRTDERGCRAAATANETLSLSFGMERANEAFL